MTMDWNNFTPSSALAGRILIGRASAVYCLVNGRILGTRGIVDGLLRPQRKGVGWRMSFLLGLLVAPMLVTDER